MRNLETILTPRSRAHFLHCCGIIRHEEVTELGLTLIDAAAAHHVDRDVTDVVVDARDAFGDDPQAGLVVLVDVFERHRVCWASDDVPLVARINRVSVVVILVLKVLDHLAVATAVYVFLDCGAAFAELLDLLADHCGISPGVHVLFHTVKDSHAVEPSSLEIIVLPCEHGNKHTNFSDV